MVRIRNAGKAYSTLGMKGSTSEHDKNQEIIETIDLITGNKREEGCDQRDKSLL